MDLDSVRKMQKLLSEDCAHQVGRVTFVIDVNGILNVSGTNKTTDKSDLVIITKDKGRLEGARAC